MKLTGKKASAELEARMDGSVKRSISKGYAPSVFMKMRQRYGTLEAMRLLLVSGNIETGFKRMSEIGLVDDSVEAVALEFLNEFGAAKNEMKAAAQWKLRLLKEAPGVEPDRPPYRT